MVRYLVRAAVAAGVDALFLEVHPNPAKALSDSATSLPLRDLDSIVREAVLLDRHVKQ
jgi:2-dehydro-3-deoxyphosphooctonate aldolase (KDO 8-P synthase)